MDFRNGAMKKISDMMKAPRASVAEQGVKKVEVDDKTLFFLSEKVVEALYGTRGRENVTPRFFRNGKLYFSCHSPLWANELWMTRETFRERINREVGREIVKEIKTSE